MRILFTGGGGVASSAWRDLLPCAMFVDSSAHGRWRVPRGSAPGFVPALLDVCAWQQPALLVPGVDEELQQIAEARESFPCPVLLPDVSIVARHLDKMASMEWLNDQGIRTPVNWPADMGWPTGVTGASRWDVMVLKPIRGRGSRHVGVVRSAEDVAAHLRCSGLRRDEMFLQTRIEGQEYTVTVVADQAKRLRAVVPVRVDEKRGVTIRGQAVVDEAATEVCRKIHQADPFSGVINVQGIKTSDGQFVPFEINPRISTTTCLAVAAGVDVFKLAMESELAPFKTVTLRRSWQNEFIA